MTPPESGQDAHHTTVSMLVVKGLVHAAEEAGVPRADFLRAAQLDAQQLDSREERMTRAEIYRLCELALDLTGDPALGLRWAARLTERMFVPISLLIASGSTLRQAFELLAQFMPLLSDDGSYRIEEGDTVRLLCVPMGCESARMQRFLAEMMMGGFWRLICSFSPGARPILVCFDYPAPAYRAAYTQQFGGAEAFDQPFTGLLFDRTLLDACSPQKDDDVREALKSVAESRLMRISDRVPYAVRVRDYLVREGWPHRTDMESAARALETSPRSLRRRLADEGKSYNDVLNDALATVAKTFLRGQRYTIQEVAYEMGFSDPSTFHRAFKRWTGTTPSAYRRAYEKVEGRE